MSAPNEGQHIEIAELLPDYVFGALSDVDLDRVQAHLETCASCQAEFEMLLVVATEVAPVSPPSLATRQTLLARIAPLPRPELAPQPPYLPLRMDGPDRSGPTHRVPGRLAWLGLAAAIVLIGLGGLAFWQQRELDEQEALIALYAEPGNAHPLTDSEVESEASAIFYVDRERDQALLAADDLPALATGQRYQVWLFTQDGQRVSAGTFAPGADGSAVVTVEAPGTFDTYWAAAISAEPEAGSPTPTSPLLLGGWIQ